MQSLTRVSQRRLAKQTIPTRCVHEEHQAKNDSHPIDESLKRRTIWFETCSGGERQITHVPSASPRRFRTISNFNQNRQFRVKRRTICATVEWQERHAKEVCGRGFTGRTPSASGMMWGPQWCPIRQQSHPQSRRF